MAIEVKHDRDTDEAVHLLSAGRKSEAASICHTLLNRFPNHPDALRLLGLIAYDEGDRHRAGALLAKAADAAPQRADILNDFGLELMAEGKYHTAIQKFDAACRLQPRMPQALFNKGLAEKSMGRISAALQSFQTVLSVQPDSFKAHFCIGDLYLTQGNLEAAVKHFRKAITIHPEYIAAYNHLSMALDAQGFPEQALQYLSKAREIAPQCAETLCNLGNAMRKMGRFNAAADMYRRAVVQRSDFVEAHFNLALVLLLAEKFEEGWRQYEWRLKHFRAGSGYPYRHGLPLWSGRPLAGRSILVYGEQGFGDILMFCRFLRNLKAMDATVVFEVRKELYGLFRHFEWADEVVLQQPDVKPHTTCDCCLPLLSLPHRLNLTKDSIDGREPYLRADPAKAEQWSRRIVGPGLKVGLVWYGSSADPTRRLELNQLTSLSEIPGISWYSLQKDTPGKFSGHASQDWLNPLGPDLKDFTDTAAAIVNLDLIISVDTAVAHLAGALGKPVWVLLPFVPDWRWFLKSQTSPWYAGMRLFRQPAAGDWQTPVLEISKALRSRIMSSTAQVSETSEVTDIDALLSAASTCRRRGEYMRAQSLYQRILRCIPDCYEAIFSLGLLYMETDRYPQAIVAYEQALCIKPDDHLCLNNLGLAFQHAGQFKSAETAFQRAVSIRPDFATAYYNLGNLYLHLGHIDSTVFWYSRALELDPTDARAQCGMGKLHLKVLDLPKAIAHFQKAVALDPQCTEAAMSLATTTLLQGDLASGWQYYRKRFNYQDFRSQAYPFHFDLPAWQGESFAGKKLIVHCEQGFGDTIQFSRFLPAVKSLGGKVIFQVQPDLMEIFTQIPGVDRLEPLPQKQPDDLDADFYIPLMDVPACLGITLETIPAPQPCLRSDRQKVDTWRRRINTSKFKIGLVWAGNPHHKNDANRSCRLADLVALSELAGIQCYSLQKDIGTTDRKILEKHTGIIHLGHQLQNFSDTAAAIECLDLLISVDTAAAHLAGAMAKPVWVLLPFLPDWRWMLNRSDSPWYPTMRLFRQPQAGDWASVGQDVCREVELLL